MFANISNAQTNKIVLVIVDINELAGKYIGMKEYHFEKFWINTLFIELVFEIKYFQITSEKHPHAKLIIFLPTEPTGNFINPRIFIQVSFIRHINHYVHVQADLIPMKI